MISKSIAAQHIARFQDLPRFPKTDAGERELVEAMAEASHDTPHAERITEALMRSLHFAPVPAEIYEAALAVVDTDEAAEPLGPKPGDQPFTGLFDLVDEKLLALFRRKAEHGKTHSERKDAKRFLKAWEAHRKKVQAEIAEGASA